MAIRVHRYADATRLNEGVAAELGRFIASVQADGLPVSLCLSDGLSNVCAALGLSEDCAAIDPEKISLWWSDDFFVDVTDPLRGSTKTLAALGTALRFVPERVHPMPTPSGNPDVDAAALVYADELGDITFDLAVLMMGSDGSVAGLRPGTKVFTKPSPHTVAGVADEFGTRLTLTLRALARSSAIWLVASGEQAAKALARTVEDDAELPSGLLRGCQFTHVFADEAAASLLPYFQCEL